MQITSLRACSTGNIGIAFNCYPTFSVARAADDQAHIHESTTFINCVARARPYRSLQLGYNVSTHAYVILKQSLSSRPIASPYRKL